MYDTRPHLVPLHNLSHAYNLFVPGLDDRLLLSVLYSVLFCVLTLCMVYGCFLSYIGVHALNEAGDLKLDAQSHRFVADLSHSNPSLADSVCHWWKQESRAVSACPATERLLI
jgi:hypothetical protein